MILLRILQTLRLPYLSSVCHPRKKQAHLQPGDPADWGDAWVWRALALPSHLRVVTYLSHERSEEEATAFLAAFKARTDGHAPLFTRDKEARQNNVSISLLNV